MIIACVFVFSDVMFLEKVWSVTLKDLFMDQAKAPLLCQQQDEPRW